MTYKNHVKCVIVGDSKIGKTSLLKIYTKKNFPTEPISEDFDNYFETLKIGDKNIYVQMWDTHSSEEYDGLRPLSYIYTDVFILCFSLVSPKSLNNIKTKWLPEIKKYCPNTPYILVGLKSDMKNDEYNGNDKIEPIEYLTGEKMKKRIHAKYYIECSAKERYNLNEVFESACKAVQPEANDFDIKGMKCTLL